MALRLAFRRLRRTSGFTTTVVLILGLGLGVGTAAFTMYNSLLLVVTAPTPGGVRFGVSTWAQDFPGVLRPEDVERVNADPPETLAWLVGTGSARSIGARIMGTSMVVHAESISGPYFATFGARPVVGRLLGPADGADSEAAAISEQLWRRMGAPAEAIGSTAFVGGQPVVIVGVVNGGFKGLDGLLSPDLWVPAGVLPLTQLYGRLKDGVTLDRANGEVRSRFQMPTPEEPARTLDVRGGFNAPVPAGMAFNVMLIIALNAIVVAIAAASVTLMLIGRLLARQGEIGIRMMLGATTGHIRRLWLAEVSIVGAAAAIVGLVASAWTSRSVFAYLARESGLPFNQIDVWPDWRVAAYVIGITVVAVIAVVAVLAGHIGSMTTLASTSAASGVGGATPRDVGTRARLIAAQVGVATCLLLLSGFFLRMAASDPGLADLGYDPSRVVIARLDQSGSDRAIVQANNRRALQVVAQTPGVGAAALTTDGGGTGVRLSSNARFGVTTIGVTPGFFDTVPLPVRRGRALLLSDSEARSPVAVISELAAERFWPHADPIGQTISIDGRNGIHYPLQVVGVVPRARFSDPAWREWPTIYMPYELVTETLKFGFNAVLLARGSAPTGVVVTNMRASIAASAPQSTYTFMGTMTEKLAADRGPAAVFARLMLIAGAFVLFLAVAGLYGLTSYLATQRHREFGIRKALGADATQLMRMVASEGLKPLVQGTLIGAGGALLIAFWLRARQFHSLDLVDPLALLAIVGALATAMIVGTVLPFAALIRRDASGMLREG